MKKLRMYVGAMMMLGLMATPVAAQQTTAPPMSEQQQQALQAGTEREQEYRQAWQQHMEETRDLRHEIAVKQHEMATMLVKPEETSEQELLAQQKEIQKLQNELQRKQLAFRWKMRQQYPEVATDIYGGCFAPAMGLGTTPGSQQDEYFGIGPMWTPGQIGEGYLGPGRMDPLPPTPRK